MKPAKNMQPKYDESVTRRAIMVAGAVAIPALLTPKISFAKTSRQMTPSQTEGPFYPLTIPADNDWDLLRNGAAQYSKGQIAWIKGVVTDADGKPVLQSVVEIWQCDHAGYYHHPSDGNKADKDFQGFGRLTVGLDGGFSFRTIRPEPYTGRTPHIHVKVKLGKKTLLTTQFYIEGHPGNAKDNIWRRLNEQERAAVTSPFVAKSDGLHANFTIVLDV